MRLVSKRFAQATTSSFIQSLAQERTITPRYDSIAFFLALLVRLPAMRFHVRSVTLVAEDLKESEHGYAWAWENLQDWEGINFTAQDISIINEANVAHTNAMRATKYFVHSGGFRTMLGLVLAHCPNLEYVFVRKLKVRSTNLVI